MLTCSSTLLQKQAHARTAPCTHTGLLHLLLLAFALRTSGTKHTRNAHTNACGDREQMETDGNKGDETFVLCSNGARLCFAVRCGQGHSQGVDWWALGVLIYEMIVGESAKYK